MEKITKKLLREWNACADGIERFCELFPEGADLETAIKGLVDDGRDSWGEWLFDKVKENKLFQNITSKGYRNTGDHNTGHSNAGNRNTGSFNAGNRNTGSFNAGYSNAGYCNTGNNNTGGFNTGYCNSGYRNSGIFCSFEPTQTLFNKPTNLMFDSPKIQQIIKVINAVKPVLTWIHSDSMSEEEKINNPSHITTGGYLKKQDFKYCWKKSWEKFNEEQRNIILNAPNFDAAVFEEITGVKNENTK